MSDDVQVMDPFGRVDAYIRGCEASERCNWFAAMIKAYASLHEREPDRESFTMGELQAEAETQGYW